MVSEKLSTSKWMLVALGSCGGEPRVMMPLPCRVQVLRRSDKANHPLVASVLDSAGMHHAQPALHATDQGKPRIQSALARSAVSLQVNHRTMVRLGLYAAQRGAGLRAVVSVAGALPDR